jgi:maleate cis-trans isomerase
MCPDAAQAARRQALVTLVSAFDALRAGLAVTRIVLLTRTRIRWPRQRKLISQAGHAAIGAAEAIVLSCTGWPTLDLIPDVQRDPGKPVLSSNLAIALHAREIEET